MALVLAYNFKSALNLLGPAKLHHELINQRKRPAEDIQMYKRAHGQDIKRGSKKERKKK